ASIGQGRTKLSEKPTWFTTCHLSQTASNDCRADAFTKMAEADKALRFWHHFLINYAFAGTGVATG
ncbi:hypothetical protein ACC735_39675, partial [Rhizobium ruizarguesonis]